MESWFILMQVWFLWKNIYLFENMSVNLLLYGGSKDYLDYVCFFIC